MRKDSPYGRREVAKKLCRNFLAIRHGSDKMTAHIVAENLHSCIPAVVDGQIFLKIPTKMEDSLTFKEGFENNN